MTQLNTAFSDVNNIDRVRELNDQLRTTGQGGRVMISSSLQSLGTSRVREVLGAVTAFDAFTPDNDPPW